MYAFACCGRVIFEGHQEAHEFALDHALSASFIPKGGSQADTILAKDRP